MASHTADGEHNCALKATVVLLAVCELPGSENDRSGALLTQKPKKLEGRQKDAEKAVNPTAR